MSVESGSESCWRGAWKDVRGWRPTGSGWQPTRQHQQERLQRSPRRGLRRREKEMSKCALMEKATDALPENDERHEMCRERRFEHRRT